MLFRSLSINVSDGFTDALTGRYFCANESRMECIRMRNFVTNSLIEENEIEDCGVYDFRFQFDSVIGEAIYVGSSSNQVCWCSCIYRVSSSIGRSTRSHLFPSLRYAVVDCETHTRALFGLTN